jgi:hypothetical protein
MLRFGVLISLFGLQILTLESSHESFGHFFQSDSPDRDRPVAHSPRMYHLCNPGSPEQSADDLVNQADDSNALVRQVLHYCYDEGPGDSSSWHSSCFSRSSNIYIYRASIVRGKLLPDNEILYLKSLKSPKLISFQIISRS